jgi:hypothetical protein
MRALEISAAFHAPEFSGHAVVRYTLNAEILTMNWVRLAAVAAAAGVLTTYTDWLLAGDWVQKRFGHPEVWREKRGILPILISTVLPFITCAGFTLLAYKLQITGIRNCLKLAFAIWILGPLPLIVAKAIFLKLHRIFLVLFAASWLVKLMIVAIMVGKYVH